MIPQLRVRTEFTFRNCYGPIDRVADRLAAIGCKSAGIVDTHGTWGHCLWEQALSKRDIQPLFGSEFVHEREDGRKVRWWGLAEDLAGFYRFSSDTTSTPRGVIRFAGAALTDPDTFDYIDINPRSRRRTRAALELERRTGKPLVLTSDNDYPDPEDRLRFLAWDDSKKMTPQHILSDAEMRTAFAFLGDRLEAAIRNTHEVAERMAGIRLRTAPMIHIEGDLAALVEQGRQYRLERGHITDWNESYQQRLERELMLIAEKDYVSYFLVVAEMVRWAKENNILVGPARGSSGGSLVCYLLRITEVDPMVHGLIFERFIDINRSDLPDIDIDFSDFKRERVFEHLVETYGGENVARIGSVNRLKSRSVMAHVGKKMGIPHGATFGVLNVLIEYSSGDSRYGKALEDTLTITEPGRTFAEKYPEAMMMGEIENHASHTGVHAAGIIVSNSPVTEYCTVRDGVAQIDKKDATYLNLLKIDVLGLRTLGVIEDTGCVTAQELYDLKLDDPEVFRVFNEQRYSGLFQFEGAAQRRVAQQIKINSFRHIDNITALSRPGPLGGGAANHYINRNNGTEEIVVRHSMMDDIVGETMGVVLYQEQTMKIVRIIGGFSWEDTSFIRKAMSGRKGDEYFNQKREEFVQGAINKGLTEEEARGIWSEVATMGSWTMNKAHTCAYSMISYWCAYMKRYHGLEYAAACLRNAKDDEMTIEMLREMSAEGVRYVPFDPDRSQANWAAVDGAVVGGFSNLIGIGPVKSMYYVQKREADGLTEEDRAKLAKHKVKHHDLRPAHTLWGHLYANPEEANVRGRIREFADLKDGDNAVVLCLMQRLDRRDENEAVRLNRRGYAKTGDVLFLDVFVVDDSISKPVLLRVRPKAWKKWGEKMADRAVPGSDWFLVRGRWLGQFSMLIVEKIRCLTNPRMFE